MFLFLTYIAAPTLIDVTSLMSENMFLHICIRGPLTTYQSYSRQLNQASVEYLEMWQMERKDDQGRAKGPLRRITHILLRCKYVY